MCGRGKRANFKISELLISGFLMESKLKFIRHVHHKLDFHSRLSKVDSKAYTPIVDSRSRLLKIMVGSIRIFMFRTLGRRTVCGFWWCASAGSTLFGRLSLYSFPGNLKIFNNSESSLVILAKPLHLAKTQT